MTAIGNSMNLMVAHAMACMLRRRSEEMTNNLFDRMDPNQTGAITKDQMAETFAALPGSEPTKDQKTVSDAFTVFDANEDGNITKAEMKSGLLKLADMLDAEYQQSRLSDVTGPSITDLLPQPPAVDKEKDDKPFSLINEDKLRAYVMSATSKGILTPSQDGLRAAA